MYQGDYLPGDVIDCFFTTVDTTGAPAALGGTPAISVYKDNSTTESVAGVTLTPSFDTRTGLNHVRITTASDGAFYAGGSTFALVITTGTVGGTSVVGYVVGSFSLAHRVKASAYSEGAIWIDTVGGVAGTTPHVHGTQHNPVSNIADATTLATALKLKRFRVAIGSTITLAQGYSGFAFWGRTWTLDLNGQSFTNGYVEGAIVVGASTGTAQKYHLCAFGTVTIPPCTVTDSVLTATWTFPSTGAYHLDGCYSGVADPSVPPVFDFGVTAAQANTLHLNHYSGGVEVRNVGQSGADNVQLSGRGRLVIAATCIAGDFFVRGLFNILNSGTPASLTTDANFERSVVAAAVLDQAITEPAAVFSWASATLRSIIAWMGALSRNKITQDATTETLRNDADAATIATSAVSDVGGVFTRGKWT